MTDIERLVENFNQWADERIDDICCLPCKSNSDYTRICLLNWARENLERLAREIKG